MRDELARKIMINPDESRDDKDDIFIENPTLSPYDRVLREEATPQTLPGIELWESQSVDSPAEPTFVSRTMRAFVTLHEKCFFLPRYMIFNAPPWTLFLGKTIILCAFGALFAYLGIGFYYQVKKKLLDIRSKASKFEKLSSQIEHIKRSRLFSAFSFV